MKLNNKGYAITIIVFGILIVFIIVLSSLLVTMNNSVKLNNTVKQDVIENIQLGADTIGMSLNERIEQLETNYASIEQKVVDKIYPVGSIYISTEDDEVSDVVTRFGGVWETYSEGRTLVGVGTSTDDNGNALVYEKNATGGSSLTTLNISNIPSHSHNIPALSGITNETGAHNHNLTVVYYSTDTLHFPSSIGQLQYTTYPSGYAISNSGTSVSNSAISSNGSHSHSVTTTASNTGSVGSGTSFSVQNPYITVYMYKRIK